MNILIFFMATMYAKFANSKSIFESACKKLVPVFDFYAGPSARGRQLYCRACNFKNMSALLTGNFYNSYIDPNRLPLLRDTDTTRFYSKDIHSVMIHSTTNDRCQNRINGTRDVKIVSTELEMSQLYQLFPQRKYKFCHNRSADPFLH